MATPELPPKATENLSDEAPRKLWFEYLGKLNDRELHAARASGFTPWALLALAGAIIYRSVPHIPQYISIPGVLTATVVFLVLEIDALFYLGTAAICLLYYCSAGLEARLRTEHNRRAYTVIAWAP